MRFLGILLLATLAANASTASAQYGLYGSPEMLPAVQQNAAPAYAAPVAYPSTNAAPIQPAAIQPASSTYSPQPQYPSQPRYAAPVQPRYQYAAPAQPRYQYAAPVQPQYAPAQSAARTTYQLPPSYRYPAQPTTTARYQAYQPGAQYRYPTPASYQTPAPQPAPMQPIPTPPGTPAGPAFDPAAVSGDVPAPQGSGMMNQMLADQNCNAGCDNGGCGPTVDCDPCGYCPWYASVSALVLGRGNGRRLWTSYVDGEETIQLTNTQFDLDWRWGGEVRFGRRFCCGCTPYALEAVYWTTDPFSGSESTSVAGGYVSTPLELNSLYFGNTLAQNWFDGAQEHRLWRKDEFHNLEVNLIRQQLACGCDSPWDIGWSLGVRYFRFQDYLEFSSLAHDASGWDDLPNTASISDKITNNLVGAQFGFDAAYRVWNNVRVFISPKVGLYDNFMDSDFEVATGNGIQGRGPYANFPVNASRNGIAFLTQIDAGVDWQFSQNWSARAGYRVVAVTGVGLADDQFPQYICDTPEIEAVSHYSSLVLHGAFVGLTYNF